MAIAGARCLRQDCRNEDHGPVSSVWTGPEFCVTPQAPVNWAVDIAVDIAVDNFVDSKSSVVLGHRAGDRSSSGDDWQECSKAEDRL
jgi:hypothetical protein